MAELKSPNARAMETTVWVGRGFSPRKGLLRLTGDRLHLELERTVAFDSPLAQLAISWPWYGFGCQFWAHAENAKYFVSFLHTGNTIVTWARGVRTGRKWHRALKQL